LSFYSNVPTELSLSASHVYVPARGMTTDASYRCMNHHFFFLGLFSLSRF